MKEQLIVSQYTYKKKPHFYEENDEPSQTIEGEAQTIKEMMEKMRAGSTVPERQVHYMDEENLDMIDKYFKPLIDLTDLDEIRERTQRLTADLSQIDDAIKAKEELKESKLKREFDKFKQQLELEKAKEESTPKEKE